MDFFSTFLGWLSIKAKSCWDSYPSLFLSYFQNLSSLATYCNIYYNSLMSYCVFLPSFGFVWWQKRDNQWLFVTKSKKSDQNLDFWSGSKVIYHSGCLDSKKILSTIDAPPGVPGVSKNHIFFYKWNCFPFALRLPPKDTNFKNHQNWRKNV